jgi:hypothetical protein
LDIAPADQRASEIEERLVDVVPPLLADFRTPIAIQPRERPLDYPPVPSQPLARFDATPSDARSYASLPKRLATAREIVALVSMQLLWALAWSSARLADRLDGVHGLLQHLRVVDVGCRVDQRERDAFSVDHNMAL